MLLVVAAVFMSFAVAKYATSATKTRSASEEVRFGKESIWMNQTGAVVAFKATNIGGADLVIDGVVVRSVEVDWGDVYYYRLPSGETFTDELDVVSFASLQGENVTIGGFTYLRASSRIPLKSSCTALFYVKNPGNLFIDEIGETVRFGLFTKNGHYITAAKVASATQQ